MSKAALLIGINYEGTENELRGCINDVIAMQKECEARGYECVVMTDHSEGEPYLPTRENILRQLVNLIVSGKEDLLFHYSGHGTYIIDENYDEVDGKDECIVPIDYDSKGVIIDDELRGVMQLLSSKQRIFCLMDCCHSGTSFDLRYVLYSNSSNTRYKMVDERKDKGTRGKCVMVSGCLDAQTSADAYIQEEYRGAMTFAFISALRNPDVATYRDLIVEMRRILQEGGYTQIPTLSSGRRLRLSDRLSLL